MTIEKINAFLQGRLQKEGLEKVKLADAARWLDEEGLLEDNPTRPGQGLRKIIGTGINGAGKEKNLWFIYPVEETKRKPATEKKPKPGDVSVIVTDLYAALSVGHSQAELIAADPIALIIRIRDTTKVAVIALARNNLTDYNEEISYVDTISMLYSKRLIDKMAVQCLHIIRRIGNLAIFEAEQLSGKSRAEAVKITVSSFLIFHEEAADKLKEIAL